MIERTFSPTLDLLGIAYLPPRHLVAKYERLLDGLTWHGWRADYRPDGGGRVSQQVSYDVYLKTDVDRLGRNESGDAVAHFMERGNAVSLKRRLEARGETVHVEKSIVYGLSESGKESWFSDFSRIPEFGLSVDPTPPEQPAPSPSREEGAQGLPRAPSGSPPRAGAQNASEGRREPWYKRWFG